MRYILLTCFLIVATHSFAQKAELFTTSKCFDFIASLQYFDKLKDHPKFSHIATDSTFMHNLNHINREITASKLCNFYAMFTDERNDLDSCVTFFNKLNKNNDIQYSNEEWIKHIVSLQPELSQCFTMIKEADYSEYWDSQIKPELDNYIRSYPIKNELLDKIHSAMTDFSGSEGLSETHSKTYVMNIDNAFNLSDESFCCTPVLLDPKMEKQFRLDFIKVYIHENLHRLKISNELMGKLDELMADDFYRENEEKAREYNEGRNEAFVVAAEVFISKKIGRRDDKSVYEEFKEYIDGSLVLAPIIYTHLNEKKDNETLNDFILRLFHSGIIKIGFIKDEYDKAMTLLIHY